MAAPQPAQAPVATMSTKAVVRNLKFSLAGSALLCAASAFAQQVLRVTAIPDESPTELARKSAPPTVNPRGSLT